MSLETLKKLEDLKARALKIHSERSAVVVPQRPLAVKAFLKEIADYLKAQDFTVQYSQSSKYGFKAIYGTVVVDVTATGDDESFIGADYEIVLKHGNRQQNIRLFVNRGTDVKSPLPGDVATQLHDYETRYLPALESLTTAELDGSYKLNSFIKSKSGIQNIHVANGKQAVDMLFEDI